MSSLSTPANAKDALDRAIAVLRTIGSDAPANVRAAVSDMISAFQQAEAALGSGGTPDYSKLQGLETRIPADAQVLEAYFAQNCAGFHS